MYSIYYILIFISGCFFGSFLKLVADRIVKGEDFIYGRSKCESCKVFLTPSNLIPVLSYISQGGKCSKCGTKLSPLYPISELSTGALFLGTAYYVSLFNSFSATSLIYFLYLIIVISMYLTMVFSDIKYMLIPDKVVYFASLLAFGFLTLTLLFNSYSLYQEVTNNVLGKYLIQSGYLKNHLILLFQSYAIDVGSAILIGLFFLSLVILTKGKGMGGGDVKLGFLIGLFNGFPYNVLGIFLGFVIGSVFSLLLIALKRKTVKDIIPFGPFLIAGSLVALFFGTYILEWYFRLI